MTKKPKKDPSPAPNEEINNCRSIAAQSLSPALTQNPAQKQDRASPISSSQKAQLEALYIVKCIQPKEIAEKLNLGVTVVHDYVYRHGLKEKRIARTKRMQERALEIADKEIDQVMDRWAAQSEDLAETAFDKIRKSAESDSKMASKDFANYTQGLRNLTGIYRESKGIARSSSSSVQVGTANIFLGGLPRADTAVDVEAKHVAE